MKILYLLNEFSDGGAELGLLTLVEHGFFDGHDVNIVALARGSGTVYSRLIDHIETNRVIYLTEDRHLRDWKLPYTHHYVRRIFRHFQPDIAILSLPQSNLLGRLAANCAPSAVIASFEHTMFYRRATAKLLMRSTAPRVDYLLYDHPATWRSIRSVYPNIPPNRGLLVPLTMLEPRPRLVQKFPLRRLLLSGRLTPQKNQAEAIEAVALLRDKGRLIELNLLGEGPDRGRLERLTRHLGLEAQVRFHGFQQDIQPHLEAADFYIQPSLWEGLCRGVLEAMAEGLLVVSTDVGGMVDYGVDGQNMIKASGPDRHRLAQALERALQLSPREISEITHRAAATVATQFSAHTVRADWRRALQVLCDASAERREVVKSGTKAHSQLEPPPSRATP